MFSLSGLPCKVCFLLVNKKSFGGAGNGDVAELIAFDGVAVDHQVRNVDEDVLKGGALAFVGGEAVGVVEVVEELFELPEFYPALFFGIAL